jgi:uncharacterized protein (UPF0332 family)
MMLDAKDKQSLSDLRMAKAREFLDDARGTLKDGRHRTAINRSYYAALAAVRSVLILEGANPETHEGAVTLLSLRLVRPGLLPPEAIKQFKVLQSRRTDVDYGDFDTVEAKEVQDAVQIATSLIDAIEKARQTLLAS